MLQTTDGTLPNGANLKIMMSPVKENMATGMLGMHHVSICDVRHPVAQDILKEIDDTMRHFDNGFLRARQDLNFILARLPLRKDWTPDMEERVTVMQLVLQDIRKRKYESLAILYKALREKTLVTEKEIKNLLPTAGRTVIARWLTGDNTISADDGCNYCSLGTSATAPANGDTQLGTETYRKATSSATYSSNIAYISIFYTATEVTGTFQECGVHIGGTGTANTGQLFSHFLTGGITKTSTETLTVESTITINGS